MRKLVGMAALLAMSAGPASGQLPAPAPAPQAAPAAKPQTVKKTVCTRVDEEETTGSRLGSAPKKCKTIEVPVGSSGSGAAPAPRPERGTR